MRGREKLTPLVGIVADAQPTASTAMHPQSHQTPASLSRRPSPIRALQPYLSRPGMLNLGGGSPNASLFPFQRLTVDLKPVCPGATEGPLVLETSALASALQYSPTAGVPSLVEELWALQSKYHKVSPNNGMEICVTNGSQDGLTRAIEMLVSPGETMLVDDPTYCGLLAFLGPYNAQLEPIPTDENGLQVDVLDQILTEWDSNPQKRGPKPRVLYTVPTGSNPNGGTLSLSRRVRLLSLAQKHSLIVLEDDPYFYLNYGEKVPSLLELSVERNCERILRFDSLSKVLSSGLRLGFITGHSEFVQSIILHMQATTLHTSSLTQAIASSLFARWRSLPTTTHTDESNTTSSSLSGFEQHCAYICAFYQHQRTLCCNAAEKHLSAQNPLNNGVALAKWSVPTAGMFFWIEIPSLSDTQPLVTQCAELNNVLLVPGEAFLANNRKSSHVRASFSTATESQMDLAFERLASVIRNQLK